MTHQFLELESRAKTSLLISFVDLTNFFKMMHELDDSAVADIVDDFYKLVTDTVNDASGLVIKFIGDAALIVFPEKYVDTGVKCLLELRGTVDRWFAEQNLKPRLIVKIHYGSVIAGPFSEGYNKRFDVMGYEVGVAATLLSKGFAISAETFRKLDAETRKLFKKHTPPITYIPVDDPRP